MRKPSPTKAFPSFLQGKSVDRDHAYVFNPSRTHAIVKGEYKIVRGQPLALYSLAKDRTETKNLAKQDPERVTEMAAIWEKLGKEEVRPFQLHSGKTLFFVFQEASSPHWGTALHGENSQLGELGVYEVKLGEDFLMSSLFRSGAPTVQAGTRGLGKE